MNSVDEIVTKIKKLKKKEKLEVLEAIVNSLKTDTKRNKLKKHSLTELKGLGKEIWKKIDVEEYIHSERDSWNT